MGKGGYQARRIQQKKQQERKARKRAKRNRKLIQVFVFVTILALIGGLAFALVVGGDKKEDLTAATNAGCTVPGAKTPNKQPIGKQSTTKLDPKKTYTAMIVTSCGTFKTQLLAKEAPKATSNFVGLARLGFYNGTIFHRVIPDFGAPGSDMVQGGDGVSANGTGDPGYAFADEHTTAFDKPGYLAMANSGPGTNGSQFFFLSGPVQHLNKPGTCPAKPGQQASCHSIFGVVLEGLDVVKKIARVPSDPQTNKPAIDVVLVSVTIEEK